MRLRESPIITQQAGKHNPVPRQLAFSRFHSEPAANLLICLGANYPKNSECALILLKVLSDFDSAVRRPSPRRWGQSHLKWPPSMNIGNRQCNEAYDRATNAHFRPENPRGATGKSLIVLSPQLTLNHRVPGSSPGAPTT
jgi:hypothetical protein